MKKNCILHVGLHKTGSSSIQLSLFHHLNDENFSFLDLGAPNHSERFYSLFVEKPELYHMNIRKGFDINHINEYNQETKQIIHNSVINSEAKSIIISGEDISVLTIQALQNLKLFLQNYFLNIKIIAYVRSPYSYFSSSFQESVKAGICDFNLKNYYHNYRNRIEKFDKVFGLSNVNVWEFNPRLFTDNNVVLDFCDKLDIKFSKNKVIRLNDSLSKEALSLLYIYYKYGPGYGEGNNVQQENNLLLESIKTLGRTKLRFSPQLIRSIIESNKDDINWIEERIQCDFHDELEEYETDIVSEESLLTINLPILDSLFQMLASQNVQNIMEFMPETLEDIAGLIHKFRQELSQ